MSSRSKKILEMVKTTLAINNNSESDSASSHNLEFLQNFTPLDIFFGNDYLMTAFLLMTKIYHQNHYQLIKEPK